MLLKMGLKMGLKVNLKVNLKVLPKTAPAYHPLLAILPDEGFQIHSRHRHVHHYQKSDEINNGKDGDYQALACTRSTLLSESRHRLAIICYKSIKNPRDGKVANPQKMMGKNQIHS